MRAVDLSSMNPSDGAIALRSLPRRYREAAATASTTDLDGPDDADVDDARLDEMAARIGPDRVSAADLVRAASDRTALLERFLRSAAVSDAAVAPSALFDGAAVEHVEGARSFNAAVEHLARRCTALADVVDDVDPARWTATIVREDGGATTLLEVLQAGVAALVRWERRIAPTLRAVRGRPGR